MSGFDDPFWTPKQAVAWVAFKHRALVDATSASVLRGLWFTNRNARLEKRRDALGEYLYKHHPTGEIHDKFQSAVVDLQEALLRGEIVASFLPEGSKQRVVADRIHWIDHDFYRWGAVGRESYTKKPYEPEVRLDAEQIKQKWPVASGPAIAKRSADEAAYEALCAMMKASPHKRPAPKAQILENLEKSISNLSRRAAERQWTRAAEDCNAPAWTQAGRPPSET